jgi:hypothetical protein
VTTRPFPVSATLTAIAIAYRNPAHTLIARRALPELPVLSEKFKYNVFPLAQGFSLTDAEVGRKGQVNQIEVTAEEADSSVKDYGLDAPIPQSDIDEAARQRAARQSMYDPEGAAVETLTNQIELHREVRVAAIVQDAGNYSSGRKVTLSGTSQLSDFDDSDPLGVLDAAMNGTLVYRPNHIVMGMAVWNKIKMHPKLLNAVKGGLTTEGWISRQQFADLMEIPLDNLLIGEGLLNTAKKGQAASLSRVWGKNIACLYLDRSKGSTDDATITWGFTAKLGDRVAGSIEDPDIGLQGGKRVRCGERVREHVCAKDVGYLIKDAVA